MALSSPPLDIGETELGHENEARAIAHHLRERGFDICHSLHPSWYNDYVRARDDQTLAQHLLPEQPDSRALLIGNSKYLWPRFLDWCLEQHMKKDGSESGQSHSGDDQYRLLSHPLDTYCREPISDVAKTHLGKHNFHIYWANEYAPRKLVSMQIASSVSGLTFHDDATNGSHMTIHPVFGAWHAFRAIVVFAAAADSKNSDDAHRVPQPPLSVPCLVTPQEQCRAKAAMNYALELCSMEDIFHLVRRNPVGNNDDSQGGNDAETKELLVAKAWIAHRDAIELGKEEHRYYRLQLLYHYTRNERYLQAALREHANQKCVA